MLLEYSTLIIYSAGAIALSCIVLLLSYSVAPQRPTIEKVTAYECGFSSFSKPRKPFYVRFYIVGLLFILFDIEISFLFPWLVSFTEIMPHGYISILAFLTILIIGYVYEWRKGALNW